PLDLSHKRVTPEPSPREKGGKEPKTPEKASPSGRLSSGGSTTLSPRIEGMRLSSPRAINSLSRRRLYVSPEDESKILAIYAPQLKTKVNSVKAALKRSLEKETALMPIRADTESSSGCYFCKDADQRQISIVAKPAEQETGGPHSPTEEAYLRPGIFPGES